MHIIYCFCLPYNLDSSMFYSFTHVLLWSPKWNRLYLIKITVCVFTQSKSIKRCPVEFSHYSCHQVNSNKTNSKMITSLGIGLWRIPNSLPVKCTNMKYSLWDFILWFLHWCWTDLGSSSFNVILINVIQHKQCIKCRPFNFC